MPGGEQRHSDRDRSGPDDRVRRVMPRWTGHERSQTVHIEADTVVG